MQEKPDFNQVFLQNRCFIKGDISGIQDFIFGVKSEGAAKTLRARSFFVFAMSKLAIEMIREKVGDLTVMYDGGGNFYLMAPEVTEDDMRIFRTTINVELEKRDLHLALSKIDYDPRDGFQPAWRALNRISVEDKLQRFQGYPLGFDKMDAPKDDSDQFKKFTGRLTKQTKGFEIGLAGRYQIDDRAISLFGRGFELSEIEPADKARHLADHIIAQLPRFGDLSDPYRTIAIQIKQREEPDETYRNNETLTFETLAAFAKYRTGTNKLAALKIDLDGLGRKLDDMTKASDAAELSNELLRFFTTEITQLWRGTFSHRHQKLDANGRPVVIDSTKKHIELTTTEVPFSDNLYIVFSGGDDCLIIGAWDAVFEFAWKFKNSFDEYQKQLKQYLPDKEEELTFSAGLVVVGAKFPVMRFAALAHDALNAAKTSNKEKNRICIFNNVLTWEEFGKSRTIAYEVRELILGKNEPRSILDRIARSARAFGRIQDRLEKTQSLRSAQVWKLYYYIRRSPNREEIHRKILVEYEKSLLATITGKSGHINPQTYPLAARWAELLTKQEKIQSS